MYVSFRATPPESIQHLCTYVLNFITTDFYCYSAPGTALWDLVYNLKYLVTIMVNSV